MKKRVHRFLSKIRVLVEIKTGEKSCKQNDFPASPGDFHFAHAVFRKQSIFWIASSLRIVIPFLYDLKGAFDPIQMKGQRLFLTGKMTGLTLFLKK